MTLSLCMIVKDEADSLPRCLESVRSLVDEQIILDTGSVDDTVAIAQSLGATVYQAAWTGDFAAARNIALQYTTGDWVLVLDADEVLTASSLPLIQQAMQQENALVINLMRQEVGAVQSPYSLVSRLFRRHPAIQFSRAYHAMIDDSVTELLQREPHWRLINLADPAILHYGYNPEAIATRDKLQKARLTMEASFAERPDDPYECSKLGALYVQIGECDRGIALLQRGLSSPIPADAPVLYELHYHLGAAYSRTKQFDLAQQHYQTAIQQPVLDRLKLGAYNNLGSLFKAQGNLEAAKAAYQQCLAIAPEFALGHYNLGTTLRGLGHLTEAIAHYQQAIQLNPNHAEAHQNLGVALLKLGKVEESMASFGRAIALHSQQSPEQAERLRQGLRDMGFQL